MRFQSKTFKRNTKALEMLKDGVDNRTIFGIFPDMPQGSLSVLRKKAGLQKLTVGRKTSFKAQEIKDLIRRNIPNSEILKQIPEAYPSIISFCRKSIGLPKQRAGRPEKQDEDLSFNECWIIANSGKIAQTEMASILKMTRQRVNQIVHRHKQLARGKCSSAISRGLICKPKQCQTCRKRKRIQMHHPDYSQPFLIEWLCLKCHGQRHRGMKKIFAKNKPK